MPYLADPFKKIQKTAGNYKSDGIYLFPHINPINGEIIGEKSMGERRRLG